MAADLWRFTNRDGAFVARVVEGRAAVELLFVGGRGAAQDWPVVELATGRSTALNPALNDARPADPIEQAAWRITRMLADAVRAFRRMERHDGRGPRVGSAQAVRVHALADALHACGVGEDRGDAIRKVEQALAEDDRHSGRSESPIT